MKCDIEIFIEDGWRHAASFTLQKEEQANRGVGGRGLFEYDLDYSLDRLDAIGIEAVSCLHPVSFEIQRLSSWPSFLLDLLPSGANRKFFLDELGIPDNPRADWPLLMIGAGNPPGNIRIAQAASPSAEEMHHPGFDRKEITARGENFIEYARENKAPVAGSSGVQGDSPKFLVTQDRFGKFHADGVLPDHRASNHWLVKFPRGKRRSDRDILRNEAAYYRVAEKMELNTGPRLQFDSDALFIPRFDRKVAGREVIRLGLESLASLAGVSAFGIPIPMEKLCSAIVRFSSLPGEDLGEFVLRDILNVAMGNTDNHGRNSAMVKYANGSIRLAPLYDFAPMFLDDQGIARTCRWTGVEKAGMPDWKRVMEMLLDFRFDMDSLKRRFPGFKAKFEKLPEIIQECGVDTWLVERLSGRIEDVRGALDEIVL